ncbi:cadherin-related protein [Elysia marginata]|uniref:Cadherin-related protein n=1 Tax=Elysia marginata TaxID=1093978 RepID=A0AAV4GNL0_9GAST|nr:cadherin-related protein [Elysia marginata]
MKCTQNLAARVVPVLSLCFLLVLLGVPQPGRCQQNSPVIFNLEEEQKADTLVGNVAEKSGIRANVTPEVFQELKYQILSSESLRIASLFTINSGTGALFTNAMIDREKVCDTTAVVCRLQFDVSVKHGVSVIKLLNVIVVVIDKNDNPPEFPTKELPLSISEAAPIGSEISISGAIDRDAGVNTDISYWMDDSSVFRLLEDKLLDVSVLRIELISALDRETESAYNLNIYAKDGNTSSALTGTLAVAITITDMNDHRPEFSQPIFNFTVKESAGLGTDIGKIEATDMDAGPNGEISFQFSSLTSSQVTRLFSLNASSGVVTVKSGLQYESGKKFQAVVEAKDNGGSPRSSQAVLVLNVVDAGNTPPRMSLTLADPLPRDSTRLSEGLPVGSFVGTLKYEDNDDNENGQVTCASLSPHFVLQPLEDNAYAIDIKTQLDRESKAEMLIVLRCSDGGSPSLSALANFTAIVTDVNDNEPVFQSSDYNVEVTERVDSVPNLIRVSATDADESVNSDVTYQLSMNSSNAFSIDPFSGWVSLTSAVDREAGSVIPLTVLAVDNGETRLTGSAVVSVYVEDVNDNRPEIIRLEYQVRENQNQGVFVAQIVAADNDVGINGELKYRLLEDFSGGFSVSEIGLITTAKTFDRESRDHYTIVVEVSDKGSPALSSTSTLTITVSDANDHSPHIIFPVPGNDTLTISAALSPGSVVAKAEARDADLGKNSKLLFIIAEGNPHKIFSIDNATGTIFVARRLTTSRETSYRLTLSVQDSGSPRMHNKTFLYLHIDFTNATLLDQTSGVEHKYVVIAGVISGITLAIAIIIIAIILKLRHMDITRCAGGRSKVKTVHGVMGQPAASVPVKHGGHLVVPAGTFRGDHSDREAGFGEDQCGGVRGPRSGMDGHAPRDFPRGTQVMGDQSDGRRLALPLSTEARPPPGHEDMSSDSSADVTTSDSGRGASDTEEAPSSGGAPRQAGPVFGSVASSLDSAPWIPPRQPVSAGSRGSGVDPPTYRDLSMPDSLPRAARAYASQKDFTKPRRPAGKVRFSVDDQLVGRDSQTGPVYWTGGARAPGSAGYGPLHGQHRVGGPPPNPSFPLLPHQRYLTSNPPPSRGLLPPLNASLDEDEDDGSTTTSGSYAVEDNILNVSVEC